MIELLYFASQIQCGINGDFLNIQVDVYKGTELVRTMNVDDKALIPVDSVNELNFEYSIVDNTTDCNSLATPSEQSLEKNTVLPERAGFSNQSSVQALLDNTDNYEELFLAELGTTDSLSAAYDMQDVIFKVDNDPVVSSLFAD